MSPASKLFVALTFVVGPSAFAQGAKPPAMRNVAVNSTPTGAEVLLDAVDGPILGKTPIKATKLAVGPHRLYFRLHGFRTQALEVVVAPTTKGFEAKLEAVAYAQVRASGPEAEGAVVTLDGNKVGQVPWDGEMAPGRHLFELSKEGFRTFSLWIELGPAQLYTLPLVLTSERKAVGSLFVTADLPGVPVFVDGTDKGVTPLTLDVPPGQTLIELRPKDLPPWKKQVQIGAGEKLIVEAAVRPESAPSGTIVVLSNVPSTLIFINGTKTGTAPVTVSNQAVGTHVVEGKAQGFQPIQTTVRVAAGEQTVVKLDLKPVEAEYGRISVRASVPGAVVYVDGGERGPAPIEADKMTLGVHSVVVRAKGYQDFEGSCEVLRNDTCSVMAALTGLSTLQITANVPGASLSVDGKDLGPLPYRGSLTVGTHQITVSAKDYADLSQTVELEAGAEPRIIEAKLDPARPDEKTVAADVERTYQLASAATALPLAPGHNAISVAVGTPYLVEATGVVGLVPGLAGGVSLRVLERDLSLAAIEIAGHVYAGLRPIKAISVGAEVEAYLGTNFHDINTRGLALYAKGTLHFGDRGAFTLRLGGDVVRDGWEPGAAISTPDDTAQLAGRFHIGADVLVWVNDEVGIYGGIDKVVGDDRILLRKSFFRAFDSDPRLYFHVGLVFGN